MQILCLKGNRNYFQCFNTICFKILDIKKNVPCITKLALKKITKTKRRKGPTKILSYCSCFCFNETNKHIYLVHVNNNNSSRELTTYSKVNCKYTFPSLLHPPTWNGRTVQTQYQHIGLSTKWKYEKWHLIKEILSVTSTVTFLCNVDLKQFTLLSNRWWDALIHTQTVGL